MPAKNLQAQRELKYAKIKLNCLRKGHLLYGSSMPAVLGIYECNKFWYVGKICKYIFVYNAFIKQML